MFLSKDDGKPFAFNTVVSVLKADYGMGDFASWNSSGGTTRGTVERILREGVLQIPNSSFTVRAEEDDPAVLLRVYRPFKDGWRKTPTLVGHKMSSLTKISPLKVVEDDK
jgi:hypothetical protein